MPASRKRVSRSPYQSRKPETTNRAAKAAVRIAFTFWPALNRPCGAWMSPREEAAVVAVEEVDLADGPRAARGGCRARRSAGSRRAQATAVQKWMSLISGRRAIAARERREVEDEPGAEQDEERGARAPSGAAARSA